MRRHEVGYQRRPGPEGSPHPGAPTTRTCASSTRWSRSASSAPRKRRCTRLGVAGYAQLNWDRTYDVPYPDLTASDDPALIERGRYLAFGPAHCASCHAPGVIFVPPNLTPDPATGHIVSWSEDQFVARFRAGPLILGTPMDWEMFARMSDTDLRAIYRYLMSLEPVENETGPTVRPKEG